MKHIIIVLNFILVTATYAAGDDSGKSKTSWYDSTKQAATRLMDKTGETSKKLWHGTENAAKTGATKTTEFVNKTAIASKEGYNAFKKSFSENDTSKKQNVPDKTS